MDEHLQLRQLELLESLSGKVDALVTDSRATAADVRSVRAEVLAVASEQGRAGARMTVFESRIGAVESKVLNLADKDTDLLRHVSSTNLEHEAALGGAIAHVAKLETSVETTSKVQAAICAELGLDHAAIVDGGRSIPPPGTSMVKTPKTTLKRISVENKGGAIMAGLTLALVIAQIVAHLFGVHLVGL